MGDKLKGERKPLFSNRGKIVFCHMCLGLNLIIHIAIIVLTVMFLLNIFESKGYRNTVFLSVLVVSILIPFILHALYILWFRTGYVVYNQGTVDIVTKFRTRSFPDNMYVFMEVKSHSLKESKVPMYYDIRLDFKSDDKTETVRLFTNQMYFFDELVKKFPEPK